MRIASSVALWLLALGACDVGVLACSSSDSGSPNDSGGAGTVAGAGASGAAGAGAGGTSAAGANTGGGGAGVSGSSGGGSSGNGASGAAGASGVGGTPGGAGGRGGSGGSSGSGGSGGSGGGSAPFLLSSPSFMAMASCSKDNVPACDQFPNDMLLTTIGGSNHSPELDWTPGPAGTLSYAIVLHDDSNNFTHWAVWNIPASASKLPASLANGADPNGLIGVKQVGFNGSGYAGPGAHSHVYQFKLYALKVATISPTLPTQNPQTAVRTALEGNTDVLATTDLRGATAP